MADLQRLYRGREPEEVALLLAGASALIKEKPDSGHSDIQTRFKVGYTEAMAIYDWLADNHKIEGKISNHWVRRGRTYVLNNPFPSLEGMTDALNIGQKRAYLVMLALEKKRLIRINKDYSFERVGRMASFKHLVHQMQVVAKKRSGRCDFQLLYRKLLVDPSTALRLAQYGEEYVGLRWKNRPKELM